MTDPPFKNHAYFVLSLFNQTRNSLRQSNPDMKNTDLMKHLGEMWRELKPELKEKYETMAKLDKERYEKQLSGYVAPQGMTPTGRPRTTKKDANNNNAVSDGTPARKSRKTKENYDPARPKRAISAYFYFSAKTRDEVKKENPDFKMTQVAKRLGVLWAGLSEEERKPFQLKAEEDKRRNEREMEAYNKQKEEETENEPSTHNFSAGDEESENEEMED